MEESISAIQQYTLNASATQDQIRVDNSIVRHQGDDDIEHESAQDEKEYLIQREENENNSSQVNAS